IHSTITLDTDVTLTAGAGGKGGTTPASNATGVAGAVSLNDVRGGASAHIDQSKLTAPTGAVAVTASETASIDATTKSQLQATETIQGKKKKFGGAANAASGSSIGAGGTIGTNVVVSGATATAT